MTRSINDVYPHLLTRVKLGHAGLVDLQPETGRGSRGDRDATLALLLHPVCDSGPLMDFAHAVYTASVEQDTLSERCLPGIDVGCDADVARLL